MGREDIGTSESVAGTISCWLAGALRRTVGEFRSSGRRMRDFLDWLAARPHFTAYDDWDLSAPLSFLYWWGNAVTRKAGAMVLRPTGSFPAAKGS